jgi:hypothetical protein
MNATAKTVAPSSSVGDMVSKTLDIRGRVQRNPYGMVAGALGIGFVLGGGLFTRLTARLAGVGLRAGLMAALPFLEKQIVAALGGPKSETKKENDQ